MLDGIPNKNINKQKNAPIFKCAHFAGDSMPNFWDKFVAMVFFFKCRRFRILNFCEKKTVLLFFFSQINFLKNN